MFVREKVTHGEPLVHFVCSQDQIANMFTKGLSTMRFTYLVSKFPVLQRPISLRGDVR